MHVSICVPQCHTVPAIMQAIHCMPEMNNHCSPGLADCQTVVRAECGDASEPLLHEPAGSESDSDSGSDSAAEVSLQKNGRRTIAALLGMSAADTPLLLLAFAAGKLLYCVS